MGLGDFLKGGVKTGLGVAVGDVGLAAEGVAELVEVVVDGSTHLKLYSVIENTRPNADVILWKHETQGFYNKSQLIVRESEEALFVKDGIIVTTFGAGKHNLTTENYPIIDSLRKAVTGGVTPFPCEIYFVDKTHKLEMKWGTDRPIQLKDAEFNFLVSVRSRGTYSIQIENAKKLFTKLTGDRKFLTNEDIEDEFKSAFQSIIKSTLAEQMMKYKKTVLDMTAEFKNLEQQVYEKLKDVLEEYGIRLVNFYIIDISIPSDDPNYKIISEAYAKAHAGKIELDVQKDMWNKLTAKELVKDIANNPGSGDSMNMATGLGVGVASAGIVTDLATELFAPLRSSASKEENKNSEKKCPKCGNPILEGNKFCSNCGERIEKEVFCSKCGQKLKEEDKFCSNCGTKREVEQ